ncbi:hypothetical protein HK101_011785 [Irineochytrium annulatum]|nr:hypothetical protein HK101_011785 [Irineochytrium annulatum]
MADEERPSSQSRSVKRQESTRGSVSSPAGVNGSKAPGPTSAKGKQIIRLTAAVPGTPLFGFGHTPIRKLSDIVSQLIERRLAPKTKSRRWWDLLRSHVNREDSASDFLSVVERMWTLVHKYAPDEQAKFAKDSTTEFVLAGWAKIKAAQHAVARLRAKKSADNLFGESSNPRQGGGGGRIGGLARGDEGAGSGIFDDAGDSAAKPESETLAPAYNAENLSGGNDDGGSQRPHSDAGNMYDGSLESMSPNEDSERSGTQGRGLLGIEGLSFDTVPNVNVTQVLKRIAGGLSVQPVGDLTYEKNLINVLVNLMISDERTENRLKAVYLLGQLGFQLGTVREHDHLLLRSNPKVFDCDRRALKIYLLHAIGKFTRYVHKGSRFIEDLVVYMLHEEFAGGDTKMPIKGQLKTASEKSDPTFVIRALLGVLDNEMKHTEYNEKYIGSIFKSFVHPLMRTSNQAMQMMAVQFISNWLPITNEDAAILGLETLEAGLKLTKDLGVRNFDRAQYDKELLALRKVTTHRRIRLII